MKRSKRVFFPHRLAALVLLAALAFLVPLGAAALVADPVDPFGGRKEVFVKDSILALAFSFKDKSAKPAVISFDLAEPGASLGSYKATHTNKRDKLPSMSNVSTRDGIPAALGKFRDEKGNLPFYVADYGESGGYVRRGYIDLSGNISGYAAFNSDMSKEKKWFATDMALADIDRDGIEDVIVGEIHRDGNDVDTLRIRILNGADGSEKTTHNLLTGNEGRESQVRFDVIPAAGEGSPTLGVTYSKHDKDLGRYYFKVFGLNEKFGMTEYKIGSGTVDEICEGDRDADAHDVAAGDFDGDGAMEFMVVADEEGHSNQVIKRYYPQPGSPSQWNAHSPLNLHYTTGTTNHDRAVARAADLDNCGRDEFIWAMTDTSGLFLLGTAGVGSNGELKTMFFNKEGDNHSTDLRDNSLRMILDMTAGSFAGRKRVDQTGKGKASGEVVILRRSWDGQQHNWLYVLSPTIGGDGRINGLEAIDSHYSENIGNEYDQSTPVLLAGNILGESLRLGDGEVTEQEEMVQVMSVIDMPPMHADYIAVPWQQSGEKIMLDATNYEGFTAGITTGTKSETSQSASTKTDSAYTAGFHVNVDTKLQMDLAAKSGQKWMNENTATGEFASAKSEQTETEYDDVVIYATNTQYFWTYPVPGERVRSGDEFIPLDYEVVVSGKAEPTYTPALSCLFYRPQHEIFNAMSYPTQFTQLPDYDPARDVVGSAATRYSTSSSIESILEWTSTTGEQASNSETITAEASFSIGVALGGMQDRVPPGVFKKKPKSSANRDDAKMIIEGTTEGSYNFEEASTISNSFTSSTSLKTTKGSSVEQGGDVAGYVSYMIRSHAYNYPNGALHFTHTSELANMSNQASSMLWSYSESPYVKSPDAALLLPYKIAMTGSDFKDQFIHSFPEEMPNRALMMKNIRITNKANREYSMLNYGQVPVEGGVSTFRFPVYNYSTGQALDNLTVRVSIAERDYGDKFRFPEETKIVLSDDVTIPSIAYKDQKVNGVPQNNWADVAVSFDTHKLTPGNYALFIELDPEDNISETHERWDYKVRSGDVAANQFAANADGDFCGNNLGFFNFSVIVAYPDETSAARAADEPVTLKLEMEKTPDLSPERIRQAIANSEDIPIRMSLYYDEGPDFVPGFVAQAVYTPDGNAGYRHGIAMRAIPGLHKGERYDIDTTLRRAFLLAYGERSGTIDIELLGTGSAFVKDGVELILPFASHGGGDSGGSSGCGTGAFGIAALAVVAELLLKRRRK